MLLGFDYSVYVINFLLAIPTFLVLRWILRRLIKSNNSLRKALLWIGTLILTPIIYVSLIVAFVSAVSYYPTRDFDADRWKSNEEKRYEMTEDIIKSEILVGKTKNEIQELLGQGYNRYGEDHWGYYVGFVPGLFKIDPDYLDIYFQDGKVKKVGQHES